MESRIDVFLSRKSEDAHLAKEIYDILTSRGLIVFDAEQSLAQMGNADYSEAIDEALEKTTHLIVVGSSAENISSGWIKAEWRFFLNRKRAGKKKGNLLTVITKDLSLDDLPPSLQNFEVIPFGKGLDKIWHYVGGKVEVPPGWQNDKPNRGQENQEKESPLFIDKENSEAHLLKVPNIVNPSAKSKKQTLTSYANGLADKSKMSLKDGDLNTAFRLAEFAYRYADANTPNVIQALIDAYYSNDHYLRRINNLNGHFSYVNSIAFSPDGKRIATGSSDQTAKIWDAASGEVLVTLTGHSGSVIGIAFSSDGKHLATASGDLTAKIWDTDSGEVLVTLTGHSGSVIAIAFSPDGKRLATGSTDQTAKIWDTESGELVTTLTGHSHYVFGIAFSPDGNGMATGSADQTAKIWDLDGGKVLKTLTGHTNGVSSIVFSPDRKFLATGSEDKTVKIWDVDKGKLWMTLTGHSDSVFDIAFSPDGKRLATCSSDQTAIIWELERRSIWITLTGHSGAIWGIAFSPDGKRLATASSDQTAKIWEIDGEQILKGWKGSDNQATGLTLAHLLKFNLQGLLDLHSNNEAKLIATKETWQIKAFADLAASEAAGSNILERVEPLYSRAERLYGAALNLQDEELIRMDYAKMVRSWASVYGSDGQAEKARELGEKADGLWKQ